MARKSHSIPSACSVPRRPQRGSTLLRSHPHAALFVFSIPSTPPNSNRHLVSPLSCNSKSFSFYNSNDVTVRFLLPVRVPPFPRQEPQKLDDSRFQGRFLFTASTSAQISMFFVDPNTGAFQDSRNSPCCLPFPQRPGIPFPGSSGQFLCECNFQTLPAQRSSVSPFQIDPVNLGRIPSSMGPASSPGSLLSGATHPPPQRQIVLRLPQLPHPLLHPIGILPAFFDRHPLATSPFPSPT